MTDSDKPAILQSIRENLAAARPAISGAVQEVEHVPAASSPPAAIDRESLVQQFTSELMAVGGRVFRARTTGEAQAYITDVVQRHQAQRIAMSTAPVLRSLAVETLLHQLGREIISLPQRSSTEELEEYKRRLMTADLGITGAGFGLADSGTLVLQTGATEGRLASLLPPVHLAVIRAEQILPGVTEYITRLGRPPRGSDVIFITGPSRTADIELTLTVGVHGPRELHALLLE